MKPSVYVITINYNSSEHTIEMVKSVLNSDYENLKIIIIDNYSSIDEYNRLKEISNLNKVILIRNEKNLGFSGGNNIGLKVAIEENAKYVMLLNNDTSIERNAITELVTCLEAKECDVVSPKILNYDDHRIINYAGGKLSLYKGAVTIFGIGEEDIGKYDDKKEITFVHGCCLMTSTEIWKMIGLMDEKYFLYFEDTALSAKFLKNKIKMFYLPNSIIYHKESVSTVKFSDNYQYYFCRNRLLYIKENIKMPIKILAYTYTSMYILKHLTKKDFKLKNVIDAIMDFKNKKFGRRVLKKNVTKKK